MATRYYFNDTIYHTFSELCRAYLKVRCRYPGKPYKREGVNIYYR